MRFLCSAAVLVFVLVSAAGAQQKPLSAEQQQVVDTVVAMFDAGKTADTAKFDSVIAPGFYMFDGGERYDGDAILIPIRKAYAAGSRIEWTVNEPDVHITGNTAWVAYVNRGVFTDSKGAATKKVWLESAILEKKEGSWKLVFFQSTPVAEPKP